jgi:hypothetical protein
LTFFLTLTQIDALTFQDNSQDSKQGDKFEATVTGIRSNVVEGEATLERAGYSFELKPDVELKEGDVLKSGSAGRAEILLQPGNYLRMSSNTRLRIVSAHYDRLRVHLESGSLGFELLKMEKPRFTEPVSYYLIRITTARSEAMLAESGVYLVNVAKEDTELHVRKGDAQLNGQRVKEKRVGREVGGITTVSEFDPKQEETFDSWCRERANSLIQVNRQLKKDTPWAKHDQDKEGVLDVPSQDDVGDSPYVVSAKPGKVTFADVGVEFTQGQEWEPLAADKSLRSQDKIRTPAYSRVELMMFPDIFFRIDGDSEVVFEELSNDAVVVRIVRGVAILEASDFDRKRLPEFKIGGAGAFAVVLSTGNYRWDVTPGAAKISVSDGRLSISGRSMDGCRHFTGAAEAECEKRRDDNFDFWSEFRGEGVMFSGRSVTNRNTRIRNRWLRDTGFWYRSPTVGYYTFVPYYATNLQSPYGGRYSVALAPRRTPIVLPDGRRQLLRVERTNANPEH